MAQERKFSTIVSVSPMLDGKVLAPKLAEVIEENREDIEGLMPGGSVILFAFSSRDRFQPMGRALYDIAQVGRMYSTMAIMRNPELGQELGEIVKHMREISKIVSKRRNKIKASREKFAQQQNGESSQPESVANNSENGESES